MQHLVNLQRSYFNSNSTKPVQFRISQLKKLKLILQQNEAQIAEAVHKDFGKSRFETILTEMFVVFDDLNMAIERLSDWASIKHAPTNLLNAPANCYIVPNPGC